MIDVWYVIVIVQLVVSLYLAWKVHSLAKEIDDTQIVVGHILHEMSQYEEETRH